MIKTVTSAVVDGYGAGEVGFLAQLGRLDSEASLAFVDNVVAPLRAVLESSDQTAVVRIQGHSDRDDTPGLSREEHRVKELTASVDRANSATDGLLELVRGEDLEFADWADVQQIVVMPTVAGGADLVHSAPSLSDAQRRQNRRVTFVVARFQPDVFL